MADKTKIEWTDATWNPIIGCQVVSAGCKNCYAMRLAGTRLKNHPTREGLTYNTKRGPVWNGEVRFNEKALDQPLRWKRPRMIFVCAHADLFYEGVPSEWIDKLFAVMALCPQHTFQVLTKRPKRMREYFQNPLFEKRLTNAVVALEPNAWDTKRWLTFDLPLPNVWLGTSVENQATADERVPHLLQTPAAVRWLSCEPLLGPVNLDTWYETIDPYCDHQIKPLSGYLSGDGFTPGYQSSKHIDWVVVGGESGPNARPMHPDWARSLRDQCDAAGVAFHFKQWGEWYPIYGRGTLNGDEETEFKPFRWIRTDGTTGESGCAPSALMIKTGKKRAGRLLDSRTWDEWPALNMGGRMMREIKFRALCQITYLQDNNQYHWVYWTPFGGVNPALCKADTLGQYTGLKDSNDIEIYEGDVVDFTYWWFDGAERECEITGTIAYSAGEMSYILQGIKGGEHLGLSGNMAFASLCFEGSDIRVIGNIHEHPELVEVRP